MTPDQYLEKVLREISVDRSKDGLGEDAKRHFESIVRSWAGTCFRSLELSGSYAKGTAIVGGSDIDLFISLNCDTPMTLKEIYEQLHQHLNQSGFQVRKQNVSLRVKHRNTTVDLVPGMWHHGSGEDHSIFVRGSNSWKKTNIHKQISFVRDSRKQSEIRLMKRWGSRQSPDIPTFVLELATIEALRGASTSSLATRIQTVLRYLNDNALTMSLPDPGCPSRSIASELSMSERTGLQAAARASLAMETWNEIVA